MRTNKYKLIKIEIRANVIGLAVREEGADIEWVQQVGLHANVDLEGLNNLIEHSSQKKKEKKQDSKHVEAHVVVGPFALNEPTGIMTRRGCRRIISRKPEGNYDDL
jgi:aryl-phospho-beta-D-glucosidase BglC (GH1 family)